MKYKIKYCDTRNQEEQERHKKYIKYKCRYKYKYIKNTHIHYFNRCLWLCVALAVAITMAVDDVGVVTNFRLQTLHIKCNLLVSPINCMFPCMCAFNAFLGFSFFLCPCHIAAALQCCILYLYQLRCTTDRDPISQTILRRFMIYLLFTQKFFLFFCLLLVFAFFCRRHVHLNGYSIIVIITIP